eukprot:15344575-Ditylum_brightwellii.AAC.1
MEACINVLEKSDKDLTKNIGIAQHEAIDKIVTKAMLSLERRCCKATHGYTWSIKLVQATCTV